MKRILLGAAVVLSSAAGFAIRSLSLKAPVAPAAEASASAQDDDERQWWEYAAVTRAQFAPSPRGGQYWIVYFRGEGGVTTTTVESGVGGNAQAKAIATLGSQGWRWSASTPHRRPPADERRAHCSYAAGGASKDEGEGLLYG